MYKFITGYCIGMLITISSMAQPATRMQNGDKALLWKISGKDLKQPSYLFGTLHIICPSDYLWTPAMQHALESSNHIIFEMDMDDPQLQAQMTSSMMLKDGKTLKDFYTPEEYKRLNVVATEQNIPVQMMQGFNPFMLLTALYLKTIPCTIPDSYEGRIAKLGEGQHKEITGLETVAEQMRVIEALNADSIAHSALEIMEHLDSFKNEYNQMLQAYKQQDLPALYSLFLQSPDYKDDLNALLFDRNKKWAPLIAGMARKHPVFVAVGAGHLWGDKGVIDLLRKQGYTVEPVY